MKKKIWVRRWIKSQRLDLGHMNSHFQVYVQVNYNQETPQIRPTFYFNNLTKLTKIFFYSSLIAISFFKEYKSS